MRLKRLLLLLPLLLVPLEAPATAQNIQVGMPIKISRLPACTYQKAGVGYWIYNGASTTDCTTGGGTTPVLCVCDGSAPWLAASTVPTGISRTGQILIAAAGAGNDVTTTAADDIALAATDDTTVTGDNVSVTSTTVTLNPGGSTVELALAAGTSTFLGSMIVPIGSAPPAACAAGTKGAIYYDSDVNFMCFCNGTNYVKFTDNSTTTGCS